MTRKLPFFSILACVVLSGALSLGIVLHEHQADKPTPKVIPIKPRANIVRPVPPALRLSSADWAGSTTSIVSTNSTGMGIMATTTMAHLVVHQDGSYQCGPRLTAAQAMQIVGPQYVGIYLALCGKHRH